MTTDEQMKLLQAAHVAALQGLMILEKVAADTLESAPPNSSIYVKAVKHQRAAYVAYDVVNIEPDILDREMAKHQTNASSIRSGWIRWLTNATDDMLLRFHENVTDALDADGLSDITPSA